MLTLSERGRHCRTCTALRRTRRWPAGLSCCVRGEGGAGGRHAATATSPPASGAGSLCSALAPAPGCDHTSLSGAAHRLRLGTADATRRRRGSQCGGREPPLAARERACAAAAPLAPRSRRQCQRQCHLAHRAGASLIRLHVSAPGSYCGAIMLVKVRPRGQDEPPPSQT